MGTKIKPQWKNGRLIPVMDKQLADFPNERWKELPEFEDFLVSDHGRLKAKEKRVMVSEGVYKLRKEKILSLCITVTGNNPNPSIRGSASKDKKGFLFAIPRMVYNLFVAPLDIYDRKYVIERKDDDYYNCHYKNLVLGFRSSDPEKDAAKNESKQQLVAENKYLELLFDMGLQNLSGEEWKYIPGCGEHYEISNYGRVKAVQRVTVQEGGKTVKIKEKIMKLHIAISKVGSKQLTAVAAVKKDDKQYSFSVQRMVYYLFVAEFDRSDTTLVITKIDGDPLNCHYKNLQLQSATTKKSAHFEDQSGDAIFRKNITPVHQYDAKGKFIRSFTSTAEAAEVSGISLNNIKLAVQLAHLQGKMYFWRKGEAQAQIEVALRKPRKKASSPINTKSVQKLNADGTIAATYASINEATKDMGYSTRDVIPDACKHDRIIEGYKWRFTPQTDVDMIHQYTVDGVFARSFKNVNEAAAFLGKEDAHIYKAIKNENILSYNSYWRKGEPRQKIDVSEFENRLGVFLRFRKRAVQKLSLDGTVLETFESTNAAANSLNTDSSHIGRACKNPNKTCAGFRWRFVE